MSARRAAFLATLVPACAVAAPAQDSFAYLEQRAGVRVVTQAGERGVPGTEGAETFAWERGGDGFVVTRGGVLERVAQDATRTVILDGFRSLRFPDVRKSDGAIVVAMQREAADDGAWRLLLVVRDGEPPIDLGPGYDPCFTASGHGVLFEAFGDGATAIWHLDLATRERRRLAQGHTPSASPLGSSVWFSSGGHLWQLDLAADADVARQITSADDYDRFASPSPDGKKLVFFRQQDGVDSAVELVLASGVERTLIEGRVELPTYRP